MFGVLSPTSGREKTRNSPRRQVSDVRSEQVLTRFTQLPHPPRPEEIYRNRKGVGDFDLGTDWVCPSRESSDLGVSRVTTFFVKTKKRSHEKILDLNTPRVSLRMGILRGVLRKKVKADLFFLGF